MKDKRICKKTNNKNMRKSIGSAISMVAILGLMILTPMIAAANPNPGVLPPDSKPYGLSYGEWSAKWWQWVLAIPTTTNPLNDATGEFCGEGQSGKVWYLAGTFGGSANRTCTIPAGKVILFPIVNVECSTAEGNGNTKAELSTCAKDLVNTVTEKYAIVDGNMLQNLDRYRVQSPLFEFTLPSDNILGLTDPVPNPSPSVSDGYWILLAPLSTGHHTIQFHAKAPPSFLLDVMYDITVG